MLYFHFDLVPKCRGCMGSWWVVRGEKDFLIKRNFQQFEAAEEQLSALSGWGMTGQEREMFYVSSNCNGSLYTRMEIPGESDGSELPQFWKREACPLNK